MLSTYKDYRERLSSLPYQVLLTVHVWYYIVFIFLAEIFILIYKAIILPYPEGYLILDFILLFFISGVESIRNFMGQKGNLTETPEPLLFSLGLTLPLIFGSVYFIFWQTYVLKLEVIINAIQLSLIALETLLGLFAVSSIARYGALKIRR